MMELIAQGFSWERPRSHATFFVPRFQASDYGRGWLCDSTKDYRNYIGTERWNSYQVKLDATDLLIRSAVDMSSEVSRLLEEIHRDLRRHIEREPSFLTTLEPMEAAPGAPEIAREMCESARLAAWVPWPLWREPLRRRGDAWSCRDALK